MWFNADWPMTSYFYLVKAKAIYYRNYRHYIHIVKVPVLPTEENMLNVQYLLLRQLYYGYTKCTCSVVFCNTVSPLFISKTFDGGLH